MARNRPRARLQAPTDVSEREDRIGFQQARRDIPAHKARRALTHWARAASDADRTLRNSAPVFDRNLVTVENNAAVVEKYSSTKWIFSGQTMPLLAPLSALAFRVIYRHREVQCLAWPAGGES